MTYRVETSSRFDRSFRKLDRPDQRKLKSWIDNNLVGCDDPRALGKPFTGNHRGLWRYRVGVYRIIADIQDDRVVILLIDIGHRREVYRSGLEKRRMGAGKGKFTIKGDFDADNKVIEDKLTGGSL